MGLKEIICIPLGCFDWLVDWFILFINLIQAGDIWKEWLSTKKMPSTDQPIIGKSMGNFLG